MRKIINWFTHPRRDIRRICRRLNIRIEDFMSRCRSQDLVYARFIISHHLKEKNLKDSEIARLINRDRSTIRHYLKQYDNLQSVKHGEFLKLINKAK